MQYSVFFTELAILVRMFSVGNSIVGGMFGVGEERTRPSSRQPSTTTDPQEDGQPSGGNGEGGEGGGEGGEGGSTEADEVIDSEQPRDEL